MSVIDVREIPGTNCYMDDESKDAVEALVNGVPLKDIHFIGSGNYHYLSYFLLGRITSPFFLVLFDNHPDCRESAFGNVLSCGGWVKSALQLHMLRRVFIVGASPEHVAEEEPFPETVTIVSVKEAVKVICEALREAVCKEPEGLGIYFSVDKDVLSTEYAVTDWDQGEMTTDKLCDLIGSIGTKARDLGINILGADICGDSKSEPNGPDHPVNRYTNERLKEVLNPLISC